MFNFFNQLMGGGEQADLKPIKEAGAVLIDVRTPGEFASGHAKGSINIPLGEIARRVDDIKAMNKPAILCCRSGNRSGSATSILKAQGVEAYNGGTWQQVDAL